MSSSRDERFAVDQRTIAEAARGFARVGLLERFEPELRKAQPGAAHQRRGAHREREAPDRQGVGRRREAEVDVLRVVECRQRDAVARPAAGAVAGQCEAHGGIARLALDERAARVPARVAVDGVVQACGQSRVRDVVRAAQAPAVGCPLDVRVLLTGDVETTPAGA